MNIFEAAAKNKDRFPYNGLISCEDLYDLTAAQLDSVYKALSAEKKASDEDSLLSEKSNEDETLARKIEIVKYVFEQKQIAIAERKEAVAKAEKKRRIMDLIASKEDEALAAKSLGELNKMLSEL